MSLIGTLLLLGLFIALQPLPAISFIAVLSSQSRTRAGWAFLAGWIGSLICVVAVAVIVVATTGGSGFNRTSAPGRATYVTQLLLGLFLLILGLRRLRGGVPPPSGPPKMLQRLEALSLPVAALIGALIQPWTLLIAGDLAILTADLHQQTTVVAIGVFCLVGTAGILGMEVYAIAAPQRADVRLGALRGWLEYHQSATITWLAIVVGVWLAIRGSRGLF